jgi:hypothetical protein
MRFNFEKLVSGYYANIAGARYPRLMGWEFLWDWVQSNRKWEDLASRDRRQTTALHLGFYLANWGMLRGSSGLLNTNLDFFEDLVVRLFDGKCVATGFWDTTLKDFLPDASRHAEACDGFDAAVQTIAEFDPEIVSGTGTLVSKILLGLWGQTPALDTYFNAGLKDYLRSHPEDRVLDRTFPSSRTLSGVAGIVGRNGWRTPKYKTHHGQNPYPLGKIVDMAFFQHGWKLLSR